MGPAWRSSFRTASLAAACLVALVGCGLLAPHGKDDVPWKDDTSGELITAAPDAGGPLSFRNCPSLEEAREAVPELVSGPDANAVPFKTMVLQCSYDLDELDVQGRPAGIGILVFDATEEGARLWDPVRTDPAFPNATDIPGLGDVAFGTGEAGFDDLWVIDGRFAFHILQTRQGGFEDDELVALARAMLTALDRAPR